MPTPQVENFADTRFFVQTQRRTPVPMTFQIGLFGRDGMVLASDTKSTEFGASLDAVSWSTTTSKIVYDEEMNTVIAMAGERLTGISGRDLIEQWDTLANSFERERLAQAPFSQHYPNAGLSALLVVRAKERMMIHFTLGAGTTSKSHTTGKVISGEGSALSLLFIERYADLLSCSMDKLKQLAAFTVWLTAQLKSTYVAGLEMIAFPDGDRPYVVGSDELKQLEQKAATLDDEVKRLISQ
jgi:hypothetical protein